MIRIATLSCCSSRFKFGLRLLLCCLVSVVGISARGALAADDPAGKPTEKELPKPEVVELETKDGLQMEATYYGSNLGKDAVPIIMLHDWKGSAADFAGLADAMQKQGHAVIVPDLRGHGKSTKIKIGNDERSIDQALMRKSDFDAMVSQDVEAVKKFLIEKNNNAELNIEKLCVVGADMGSLIGMEWAVNDWAAPKLLTGKQGQDVKALVLISPPMNFRGISCSGALDALARQSDPYFSVLIMVGGDKGGKSLDDAQRIFNKFAQMRPKPPTDPDEIRKNKDLFLDNVKTSLQGTKIFGDPKLQARASADIGQFIELRLVDKKFPWAIRKSALGN